MNQIRWSSLMTTQFATSNPCGGDTVESGSSTACQAVKEFVLDPARDTFASLQEPPSLVSLLGQSHLVACSHVF